MLYRLSDGEVLAIRVKQADSFIKRLKGLMFLKQFPDDFGALVLSPCNAVHTMFMRYNIDAIFLDKHLNVLFICHQLMPGRFSPVVKNAKYVIELPAGVLVKCDIRLGDRLMLSEQGKAV